MNYLEKHAELKDVKLDHGQEQIVKQLEGFVEDSSMNVIGLEGEWGSGKSTILKALKEQNKEKYYCYEYDLWAHQEDNLRYSFLRGLLEKFKDENNYNEFRNRIENLISSRTESSGPKINYKMVGLIFVMFLIPIFGSIANVLWEEENIVYITANLFFPIAVVSLLYLGNKVKNCNEGDKVKTLFFLIVTIILLVIFLIVDVGFFINWNVDACILLTQIACIIGFLVFLFKLYKKTPEYTESSFVLDALSMYNEKFVEMSYSTKIQPRMEDVQLFLEEFFKDLFVELSKIKRMIGEPQVVVVFDNLDRLPPNKIRDFWTFLQTFFVAKKYGSVTTIIAYERNSVEKALGKEIGKAYLEKSLDFNIYVPLCSRKDLKDFFDSLWNEAEEDKNSAEKVFNLYYYLKRSDVSFGSRRGIIDAINQVKEKKELVDAFFNEGKVLGNTEQVDIKYPFELAAMYVFRKNRINKMFSDTVKTGIVQYYINAFDDCKEWVSLFIPEKDKDGKKMCLQRIYNRIIQNNNINANNMESYYIIDYFYKGRLEYYFSYWHDHSEMEKDFEYIWTDAIQRINDGTDASNVVKSFLYCQKEVKSLEESIREKWRLLFEKIRKLKKWPKEAWCWNALFYNSREYLEEFVWENDVMISYPREYFIVNQLRTRYAKEPLIGKICLTANYREKLSSDFPEPDIGNDEKNFFYEGGGADDSLIIKQLNKFKQEDWERSLVNFWYPGVIHYYGLKEGSKYNSTKYLVAAIRKFFKSIFKSSVYYIAPFQMGPCRNDECYYRIWLKLINILSYQDRKKLEEQIKNFFPKKYHEEVDIIIKKKKTRRKSV